MLLTDEMIRVIDFVCDEKCWVAGDSALGKNWCIYCREPASYSPARGKYLCKHLDTCVHVRAKAIKKGLKEEST